MFTLTTAGWFVVIFRPFYTPRGRKKVFGVGEIYRI